MILVARVSADGRVMGLYDRDYMRDVPVYREMTTGTSPRGRVRLGGDAMVWIVVLAVATIAAQQLFSWLGYSLP